ncbi:MAG: hypothetical protein CVV47_15430 [Spirochaetae bacterium HGW-Spirochaetae-3]|jgi:hypothetical protein|nr:MAG: hypothetical protein CVV47_15430 [Spirochaetae bacterium HGW-Spirochaetae-3]
MPDASGLLGAVGPVAAALAPVALLLFVALRLRKRVYYPHELLSPKDDGRPAAALFRSLRLHYDTAIDAACAVIVGLAIAGYPGPALWKGPATAIDASRSMLAGLRGDRPLDEAARLLFSDGTLRGQAVFTLGWDPLTRRNTVRDVTEALEDADSPQEFAMALESSESFMSADYGLLSELSRRGYGGLTLLTDDASAEGLGVDVRRLSAKPPRYLALASAVWDDERERSVARFVTAGGAEIEALWELIADGSMRRAKPEDYEIIPSPSGFELSFKGQGLWAAQWDGRRLPFAAPGRPEPLSASGALSKRIVAALGSIGTKARAGEYGIVVRDGGGAGARGFVSVSRVDEEPYVLPPRLTRGAVVAAGMDRKADLALGESSFASPEAAIPFYLARAASGAAVAPAPRPRASPVRVGEGFLYAAAGGRRAFVVVPPSDEYAPSGRRTVVEAGTVPDRRLLVALALASLYGLKLWLAARLRGRR